MSQQSLCGSYRDGHECGFPAERAERAEGKGVVLQNTNILREAGRVARKRIRGRTGIRKEEKQEAVL